MGEEPPTPGPRVFICAVGLVTAARTRRGGRGGRTTSQVRTERLSRRERRLRLLLLPSCTARSRAYAPTLTREQTFKLLILKELQPYGKFARKVQLTHSSDLMVRILPHMPPFLCVYRLFLLFR